MKINKMLKNALIITILAFLLCFFMSGCSQSTVSNKSSASSQSAVSEKNLLSYIEKDNPMDPRMPRRYDSTGEIRYYDLEVDKRLTDEDARSDKIWVRFSVDTDTDSADVEACMYFTLYNDGWRLDDLEILSLMYTPLAGPSQEEVRSYLSGRYDYYQYQGEEINLDNGYASFYYKAINEYTYADYGYNVCVRLYYSGPYWNYSRTEILEETQDWRRIYGTWEVTYGAVKAAVTINSLDLDNQYMGGSYRCVYREYGFGWEDDHVYENNGVFKIIDPTYKNVVFERDYYMTVAIRLDPDEGVIFGSNRPMSQTSTTSNVLSAEQEATGYIKAFAKSAGLKSFDPENPICGVWDWESDDYNFGTTAWCIWPDGTFDAYVNADDGGPLERDEVGRLAYSGEWEYDGTNLFMFCDSFEVVWYDDDTFELITGYPEYFIAHRLRY